MAVERIPEHAARDRALVVQYLIDLAGHVASGRPTIDPYGVLVVLVGVEGADAGARGIRFVHDFDRAIRAAQEKAQQALDR